MAARAGHGSVVQALLAGADVDKLATKSDTGTALLFAASIGRLEVVQLLLARLPPSALRRMMTAAA
jgi:ankyrin repeat protein